MLKLRACLVTSGIIAFLAPSALAGDYGTGGGVGAEAPDLAPLPPKGEQGTPAPPSEETGATTDKSPDDHDQTPAATPADQQK